MELVVIAGQVVMPLGVELVVIAGQVEFPLGVELVMPLGMEPVVTTEPVVMHLAMVEPVVIVEQVVIAEPPVVMHLAEPRVFDQAIRYLAYAKELWCRHIVQGNSYHLQWGCLSHYTHKLNSILAPLVRMHTVLGLASPKKKPPTGSTRALATSFVFPALPIG